MDRTTRPGLLMCVALAIALLLGQAGGAHAAPVDLFRQHYDHALGLYSEGKLDAALEAFRAAYAVRQLPRLLINIARIHRRLGHLKEALRSYDMYQRLEATPPPALKKDVEDDIARLIELIEAADHQVGPENKAPSPAAARATAPPPLPVLALRTERRPATTTPLHRRWWVWTLAGAAAAGVAIGVGVGVGTSRGGPDAPVTHFPHTMVF